MQRQPVVPLFLYVCACVSVTWARHILNFISAFLGGQDKQHRALRCARCKSGYGKYTWACLGACERVASSRKKNPDCTNKNLFWNHSLCSFHHTWGLKPSTSTSDGQREWKKKKQEEDLKSSQKGATGDACRVRVTKKNPKQNTTVCCFLPLRPTHTCKLSNSANTQTLYTPPRSVLVDVYSWPDQITCDTGMKSGQAQSFSLIYPLFLWPSLSHKSWLTWETRHVIISSGVSSLLFEASLPVL